MASGGRYISESTKSTNEPRLRASPSFRCAQRSGPIRTKVSAYGAAICAVASVEKLSTTSSSMLVWRCSRTERRHRARVRAEFLVGTMTLTSSSRSIASIITCRVPLWLYRRLRTLFVSYKSLLTCFEGKLWECWKTAFVKLLILNWRDFWHPRAGGAELVTLRVAERLVRFGWDVEWFSAHYAGAAREELRDGIHYVRGGSQKTVHLAAWRTYRKRADFDIAIDEINTIPFYAHAYLPCPVLTYFQQLAQEVWRYEAPWPLGMLGARAERAYLAPYRDRPTISISRSSIASLEAIGLRGPFFTFPMCVDEAADRERPMKAERQDIVVLGRVTPSKRIEESIQAAALLSRTGWRGTLTVVGGGEARYLADLERRAQRLLPGRVTFAGKVSNAERTRLLQSASCLWMTSAREGWGLAVTEAARHWTPAVVYDVPGLRDSVENAVTGFVVPAQPQSLADATAGLFATGLRLFGEQARDRAAALTWDASAHEFEAVLQHLLRAPVGAAVTRR